MILDFGGLIKNINPTDTDADKRHVKYILRYYERKTRGRNFHGILTLAILVRLRFCFVDSVLET